MKVENMTNSRGNTVPNQFVIQNEYYDVFQSYVTTIARICKTTGETELDSRYWDYSPTTSKYRNIFLGEDTKATKAKIKSGVYKLVDLNA